MRQLGACKRFVNDVCTMSKQLFEPGKSEAFRTNEETANILNQVAETTGLKGKGDVIKAAICSKSATVVAESLHDTAELMREELKKAYEANDELAENLKATQRLLEDAVNKPSETVNNKELEDANQKLLFKVKHLEEELATAKASAQELKAIQVNQILITLNIPQMKTLGRVRKSLLAIDVEVTEEPGDVLLAAATVLDQHMQNMAALLKPYKNLIADGN